MRTRMMRKGLHRIMRTRMMRKGVHRIMEVLVARMMIQHEAHPPVIRSRGLHVAMLC